MTEKEQKLFDRGLPKWPKMYVTGVSISPLQAMEIIRRTDSFFYGYDGNNKELNELVQEMVSLPTINSYKNYEDYDSDKEKWEKNWGLIHCYYVENGWISNCFILGAHGWCHPNGKIGYSTNVGKWPDIKDIYQEWTLIAETFPYLELGITLYDGEWSEEDIKPVVSMKVKNGKVNLIDPEEENVHEGHDYESNQDYLESINLFPYKDSNTGKIIKYTDENAIPLEVIKEWGKKFNNE